jgi:sugar-specific transcriptional regulator TrmB
MSLTRVIQALVALGLSRVDAEVYVHLAKRGPVEIVNLATALRLSKKKLANSLNILRSKGIVTGTFEDNTRFSALPFEQAIELLINIKTEQTQIMQETKEDLFHSWRKMIEDRSEKS